MLQQWRKPLTIVISPEGVAIDTSNKNSHRFDVDSTLSSPIRSWLEVLTGFEKNAALIGKRKVKFIISNHYVRYEALSWQSNVFSRQDWQSIAENHMRSLHGNIIDGWKIQTGMQGYGQPIVVSAIDRLLLTRLHALARQYNWIIDAVEPALMSVTNNYRNKMKNDAWLLMVEPQRVLLAEAAYGVWHKFTVSAPPSGQESAQSLSLVKRAISLQNKAKSINIHFFGDDKFQLNNLLSGVEINSLVQNNTNNNTRTIMAELI